MTRALAGLALVALAGGAIAVVAVTWRRGETAARCAPGFTAIGARCCPGAAAEEDACIVHDVPCPAPLVPMAGSCGAPDVRVLVPAAEVLVGPSDWEAEGRVAPRVVRARAFRIDAFEVTVGRLARGFARERAAGDLARAAFGVTASDAAAFCASVGGRLPTEAEWIVAAAGASARRYPWGDTGAVCRRAAWGLVSGPCASGARGPDTVGAHGDGASPLGIHDLAGNVAEWIVTPDSARAEDGADGAPGAAAQRVSTRARGGSWQSGLATELRTWSELDLRDDARPRGARASTADDRVGFRCAYDE